MNLLFFFILAFLAEFAGTIAGFGSSTLLMPLAVFFFEFPVALTLVAFFHLFGNIGRISFFKHSFDKRIFLLFGIPSIFLTILGAFLVAFISQPLLKVLLGTFLLGYAIFSFVKETFKLKTTIPNCIIGGSLSGFFAGLIGTGGALRGAFLTAFHLEKSVYIATAAAIALVVDLTRIPVYVLNKFLPPNQYLLLPFLAVIALAGAFAGKKAVSSLHQKLFRKIVLACIALVSIQLLIEGIQLL